MRRLALIVLCAWVLWEANATIVGDKAIDKDLTWQPATAMETEAACKAQLADELTERDDPKVKRTITGTLVVDELKGGNVRVMRLFRCLPDTIDPRGPKR